MEDRVVAMLRDALLMAGHDALAFNFRGVGASDGDHDAGRGEVDDVLAALSWLEQAHIEEASPEAAMPEARPRQAGSQPEPQKPGPQKPGPQQEPQVASEYSRITLAGYSFGGAMAILAALRQPVSALVLAAPAISLTPPFEPPETPTLIVIGAADQFVPAETLADRLPAAELCLMPGVDHFFSGCGAGEQVRTSVTAFLEANAWN